jgi:hypothetical protein
VHEFLQLPAQRRNGKQDDGRGDSNQRKHHQDDTNEARYAVFL